MGEALRMPPRETVLLNILPRIIGHPSDAKPDDAVDVEWIPNDGFRMFSDRVTTTIGQFRSLARPS